MSLNACCNLIIFFIQLFSIATTCQRLNGIFCSRLHKLIVFQFYRIIFVEYVSHVVHVMSNLSYICYSINRLSLIGQKHGKLVTYVSELKLKNFFCKTFLFCLFLPISKMFRFLPNFDNPLNSYPDTFDSKFKVFSFPIILSYVILSIIYNLINSLGFIVINLVVDISILITMKNVMEKQEKDLITVVVQTSKDRKK